MNNPRVGISDIILTISAVILRRQCSSLVMRTLGTLLLCSSNSDIIQYLISHWKCSCVGIPFSNIVL